jgi:hypothetical protein
VNTPAQEAAAAVMHVGSEHAPAAYAPPEPAHAYQPAEEVSLAPAQLPAARREPETEQRELELDAIQAAASEERVAPRPQPVVEPAVVQTTVEAAAYRARPASQSYALPSDLVQVETSSAAPTPELSVTTADEPSQPRRPRRPPPEPVVNEPLVQIETRSDGEPG